jgi:hypothetical protein
MVRRKTMWFLLVFVLILGLVQGLGLGTVQAAITQCDYAVELAERLGLGKGLSADEAISALTKAGIAPKEGWRCDVAVTSAFLNEIQDLVVIAARKGLIPFSEEHALDMLASLSRDLDLPIPTRRVFGGPPPPVGVGAGGGPGVASSSK